MECLALFVPAFSRGEKASNIRLIFEQGTVHEEYLLHLYAAAEGNSELFFYPDKDRKKVNNSD